MKTCEICNTEHRRRSRFCSQRCKEVGMWRRQCRLFTFTCPDCGQSREVSTTKWKYQKRQGKSLCPSCEARRISNLSKDGEQNPNWKGGHKHWSKGRYGKDKDGLSWRVQRKLAWERDQYTCQHCGDKGKRNPDVHHITPWLNSQSHALDNLICLCQKCHLKEEAKVQEVWGGQLIESPGGISEETRRKMSESAKRRDPPPSHGGKKVVNNGIINKKVLPEVADELVKQGWTRGALPKGPDKKK